jgi:hypothetical protein
MLLPLLRASVAIANLCLIAATRNLWFGDSGFPMIPLVSNLTDVPPWVDDALSTLLIAALLLLAGVSIRDVIQLRSPQHTPESPPSSPGRKTTVRLACTLIVSVGVGLALLNQHRLQPWLYHLLLLCPILALDDQQSVTPTTKRTPFSLPGLLVLFLTASIYFWSAISKCDRAFVESHGQTFVSAIASVLGLSLRFWSPGQRELAAAALPLGELLVAISLLVPKTRRPGLLISLLMHGLLITAVGQWGMDQRPGVILWNVLFISQNILLLRFLTSRQTSRESEPHCSADKEPSSHSLLLARCVVIVAAIAPAFRFGGWFDNWPAWAVYTASNERAYILIAEDAVGRLPPGIGRFVQPGTVNDGWFWLRIDLWSIATVDAPVYPQKRFLTACGLAVAQLPEMQNSVRLLLESSADPLTGHRTTQSCAGSDCLQQLAGEFTLNLQARPATLRRPHAASVRMQTPPETESR